MTSLQTKNKQTAAFHLSFYKGLTKATSDYLQHETFEDNFHMPLLNFT